MRQPYDASIEVSACTASPAFKGLTMNAGTWFGEQYENFVHFNYGTNRKKKEGALKRIEKAIEDLQ